MRNAAKTTSFVERVEDLKLMIGGRQPEVDALITDLLLGAQAVDQIKRRAVMLLETDTIGSQWHDRQDRELLQLAEFTYNSGRG